MLLPCCLLLFLFHSTFAVLDQSIAVKGRLMCGEKPLVHTRIKLWDEDTGPDPDDLLDQGYTDKNGDFLLKGGTAELTPIDPVFKAYHDCNDGITPGYRKARFLLPKNYITKGTVPNSTVDMGILNLEVEFQSESREYILS